MFVFNKKALLATAAILSTLATSAMAEDSTATANAGTQQSSSSLGSLIAGKTKASYMLWLTGPKWKAIDGTEGDGKSLALTHFPSLGYKISSKWSASVTQMMTQSFDSDSSKEHWVMNDPYISFSNSNITSSSKYNTSLAGYVRYYAPFSQSTNKKVGSYTDQGNGAVRVAFMPTKTFLDGALSISSTDLFQYRLARSSAHERADLTNGANSKRAGDSAREDYKFLFDNSIEYDFNSKIGVYLEYSTAAFRHNTNGQLTTFNDPDTGQYVSPGVNWAPTKKVLVNPYISWGPTSYQINNADVGVVVQYTFL